mgnify:CR=1
MKDFKDIIEEWAIKYKPMQHTPGKTGKNKRFYLFDNIVSIPNIVSNLPNMKSPCVGYEFSQEGRIKGGKIMPTHIIYFMVKAANNTATDKEVSYEAEREAVTHMLKFIAWIRGQQETRKELANINVETEDIHYSTYGPFMNNWYAIFIELSDVETFNICIDKNDYIEEEEVQE